MLDLDHSTFFDFHGVHVQITADRDDLIAALNHDFSYFRVASPAAAPEVQISAHLRAPPWRELPHARSSRVQPECVVYDVGEDRWVDYQGQALTRWRHADEAGAVWSEEFQLLHEIVYLLLLSRVGELHDQRGIHRVHALGLRVRGRGVICLLPSGGGKTTMSLRALRDPTIEFLSDDTPLVTRNGKILPFPIRIGFLGDPPADVPERYLRKFTRRKYGEKWLMDISAFADRIAKGETPPGALLLGERRLNGPTEIEEVPARAVAPELFRSLTVGIGLPQLLEYFLRMTPADIASKSALVASRTQACAALLWRSRCFRFTLGRDTEENYRQLMATLQTL